MHDAAAATLFDTPLLPLAAMRYRLPQFRVACLRHDTPPPHYYGAPQIRDAI